MNSDGVDIGHDTGVEYQPKPIRIEWSHSSQERLLAAVPCPVGCTPNHLTENLPPGIQCPIPVTEVIRLVPEFDPLEVLSVSRDDHIQEVGVRLRVSRWR